MAIFGKKKRCVAIARVKKQVKQRRGLECSLSFFSSSRPIMDMKGRSRIHAAQRQIAVNSSVSPIRSRSCETHLICVRACIEMARWRWRAKGKVSNGAHTATLGAIHIHNNCCDAFTAQNTRCNRDGAFLKEEDRGSRCNTSRPEI